jgi:hypothetical protein
MADILVVVASVLGCFAVIYGFGYAAGWLISVFTTIATME